MDYRRITLAAFLALGVRLLFGILVWIAPFADEFAKYPTMLRPMPIFRDNVPLTLAGWFVAVLVLAVVFAKGYAGGNGALEGFRFGSLMAFFTVGFVSMSMYAQVNIGLRMAIIGGAQLFLEMVIIGTVIGAAYEPERPMSAPKLVRAA